MVRNEGFARRFFKDVMKTYKNLFEQLITKENFETAYRKAIKGKSRQKQVVNFNQNKEENLEKVRQSVINGTFTTSKYVLKKIYEPKERIIYILPFMPDRIVQHAIVNILEPIFLKKFISNSCACIPGRGQLMASQIAMNYARKNKFVLKCDIRHFYPEIRHKILSEKLHKIIKDERFMSIVDDVIYSIEGGKNCPIGNYLSQWRGNFYLTFLDNYVKHVLRCKNYVRYCDDFILFDNSKSQLHSWRLMIADFLKNELELEYSKSDVFSIRQGVDFVGYREFGKYILVRKSTAKRIKRQMRKIPELKENGFSKETLRGKVASANGILKHANTYRLRKAMGFENLKAAVK